MTGNLVITGNLTATGDLTVSPPTDNGKTFNQITGLFKIGIATTAGISVDGTGDTVLLMDDSPIGECKPIQDGDETAESTIVRVGSGSYKYAWDATVVDNDGLDCDITPHTNTGADSLGFWLYSTVTFASGDLDASLDDGTAIEANAVVPAYSTANVWQWMEVDFDSDCNSNCGDADGVFIQATSQDPTNFNGATMYIDEGAVWLSEAEEPIGAIIADGVLGVWAVINADANVHATVVLVEWTDYLIHTQSGADAIVIITNQVTKNLTILQALE